jgi:DNA gyrase subunit A
MGRATSGVTGMKFRAGDELLAMDVVEDDHAFVFVVTEAGYAKRTPLSEYRLQGRAGLGIKVAKLTDERGDLVSGMIVNHDHEVLVVMERGKVVRSRVEGVPAKGRDTMGVVFAKPDPGDRIIAVAANFDRELGQMDEEGAEEAVPLATMGAADGSDAAAASDGDADGVPSSGSEDGGDE